MSGFNCRTGLPYRSPDAAMLPSWGMLATGVCRKFGCETNIYPVSLTYPGNGSAINALVASFMARSKSPLTSKHGMLSPRHADWTCLDQERTSVVTLETNSGAADANHGFGPRAAATSEAVADDLTRNTTRRANAERSRAAVSGVTTSPSMP